MLARIILMKIKKTLKKFLTTTLAITCMTGMVIPVLAEGQESPESATGYLSLSEAPTPTIIMTNRYPGHKGESELDRTIIGAKFDIVKTGNYVENTGEITAIPTNDQKTKYAIEISDGSKENTSAKPQVTQELTEGGKWGRYDIIQTQRAPGMYANRVFSKDTKTPYLQARVEFPIMAKDGQFSKAQTFTIHPKYDSISKDVIINKVKDDGSALEGVKFGVKNLLGNGSIALQNFANSNSFDNVAKLLEAIENKEATTSKEGIATFKGLPVGIYELTEKETVDGYQKVTAPMYFAIYSTGVLSSNAKTEGQKDEKDTPVVIKVINNSNKDTIKKELGESVDFHGVELESIFSQIDTHLKKSRLESDNNNTTLKLANYVVPKFEKEIQAEGKTYTGDNVYLTQVGTTFDYILSSNIPGDIESYEGLTISDWFDNDRPQCIDYKGGLKLMADATELKLDDDYSVYEAKEKYVDYTKHIEEGPWTTKLEVTLTKKGLEKMKGKQKLVLTFKAAINGKAESNKDISNKAFFTFTNIYNGEGEMSTSTIAKAKIFKGNVTIYKVDGSNHDIKLEGAKFQLFTDKDIKKPYKNPNTKEDVVATTDTKGKATFENLPEGTYYLKEVKAPNNYKLSSAFYKLEVKKGDNGEVRFTLDNSLTNGNIVDGDKFTNFKTTSLMPDTGTRGLIPYALAALAMAGIGFGVLRKKKNNPANN